MPKYFLGPIPWWTSVSTMAILRRPYFLRRYSTMMASLLILQKPRLPWATVMAWCPGGRTKAKPFLISLFITASAITRAEPADTRWASVIWASTLGTQKWTRAISLWVASPLLYSRIWGRSITPSSKSWSRVYRSRSSRSGWVGEIAQSKAGKKPIQSVSFAHPWYSFINPGAICTPMSNILPEVLHPGLR